MNPVFEPEIISGMVDTRPALWLDIGPHGGWSVFIDPDDFASIQDRTGFHHWGVRAGRVVVGDPAASGGCLSVANLITGASNGNGTRTVYRDGSPLNLLRSNLGLETKGGRWRYWLELRPGETDPTLAADGRPLVPPAALLRHRSIVPGPRPALTVLQNRLPRASEAETQFRAGVA